MMKLINLVDLGTINNSEIVLNRTWKFTDKETDTSLTVYIHITTWHTRPGQIVRLPFPYVGKIPDFADLLPDFIAFYQVFLQQGRVALGK